MIGKVVNSLLKNNTALLALVPAANIFPYTTNEDTMLPAIVYTIDSVNPQYSKDGWNNDECVFSIASFHTNYSLLQNIVEQVRASFEFKKGTAAGIKYKQIYMTGQKEDYSISAQGDIFGNKLTFETIIYK